MPGKEGKAPVLTDTQLQVTLRMCEGTRHGRRDQAIVLVSHHLGLRAKEIAGLTVEDVCDAREGLREVLRLRRATTKGARWREAYLVHGPTRQAVAAYLEERRAREGEALQGPLFLSQKGGGFSADTLQKLLKQIYARAGIVASSHSGRRTFATRLAEAGANLRDIQKLMDHASIALTAEYVEVRIPSLIGH